MARLPLTFKARPRGEPSHRGKPQDAEPRAEGGSEPGSASQPGAAGETSRAGLRTGKRGAACFSLHAILRDRGGAQEVGGVEVADQTHQPGDHARGLDAPQRRQPLVELILALVARARRPRPLTFVSANRREKRVVADENPRAIGGRRGGVGPGCDGQPRRGPRRGTRSPTAVGHGGSRRAGCQVGPRTTGPSAVQVSGSMHIRRAVRRASHA